ncbi:hypothetical protein GON01_14935 [Sphingomonas sp. MAH-20]|uniref:Uncharacterized protein n=1 Tax=Sphingomonas horti TaxID=2682842 RepID=A0A6I4J4G8_9SPHN|nr:MULTISPECIES: hypothetical protein [Sphingomonas]MBA2919193.1 hypothetical protein [Sphingomonas sp. CGMCC 1.13658]MVO79226.1 hypothetical protein [Sphingomonas horti]
MIRFAVTVLTAFALAAPAVAADEPPAAIQALGACRAIADNAQRLACYDQAAGALLQSVERKETVVLDKQAVTKTKRSLFGFSLPRLPFFGNDKDDKEDEFTQIEEPITTVRSIGYGRFRFTLGDGATWETTEGINAFPKPGQKVLIKKGLMGSYFIKFEGNRSVKGMRVG